MGLRVVLVDDEKPARDRLRRLLSEHPDCAVIGEAGDASSAIDLIDRERPDLCFLDVQMPEGDGFEVLRRIRHRPRVIFTTAFDQYAVPAFEVRSIDYLLKPFSRERFAAALERAREAHRSGTPQDEEIVRLLKEIQSGLARPDAAAAAGTPVAGAPAVSGPAPVRIPARRGTRVILLDPSEILWFEAEETIVFARTVEARLIVDRSLGDLEQQLSPGFFRTHRRYLVNVVRIREILPGDGGGYRVVMHDEAKSAVPLSRRQARALRDLIRW
jgi:DNA-binding LytR/AlgR family response regulator